MPEKGFELVYYDVEIEHVSPYTYGIPLLLSVIFSLSYEISTLVGYLVPNWSLNVIPSSNSN